MADGQHAPQARTNIAEILVQHTLSMTIFKVKRKTDARCEQPQCMKMYAKSFQVPGIRERNPLLSW